MMFDIEIQLELHMDLHMELHMDRHMELHMRSIWSPIEAERRSPSRQIALPQNKIRTPQRPTKRNEACSDRSDEIRDCKLHITQTKDCTQHKRLHITHTHTHTHTLNRTHNTD